MRELQFCPVEKGEVVPLVPTRPDREEETLTEAACFSFSWTPAYTAGVQVPWVAFLEAAMPSRYVKVAGGFPKDGGREQRGCVAVSGAKD